MEDLLYLTGCVYRVCSFFHGRVLATSGGGQTGLESDLECYDSHGAGFSNVSAKLGEVDTARSSSVSRCPSDNATHRWLFDKRSIAQVSCTRSPCCAPESEAFAWVRQSPRHGSSWLRIDIGPRTQRPSYRCWHLRRHRTLSDSCPGVAAEVHCERRPRQTWTRRPCRSYTSKQWCAPP